MQRLSHSPVSKDYNALSGEFIASKLRKFSEVQEKDQEKQFENDQDSVEDIIDNDITYVAVSGKSKNFCCYRKSNCIVKEATNKQTRNLERHFPNKKLSYQRL